MSRDAKVAGHLFATAGTSLDRQDIDRALARLERRSQAATPHRRELRRARPIRWRLMGTSLGTGTSVAAAVVAIAGVTAAATLTTIFSPTKVVPVKVSTGELRPIVSLLGMDTGTLGGLPRRSGSKTLPFGVVHWTSSGRAKAVTSLAAAEAETGLRIALPRSLPNGVGQPREFLVVPRVTAVLRFSASAGPSLSGSSLVVTLGPAVAIDYRALSTATGHLSPLGIASMRRPVVRSSGATLAELERFLFSRPGLPHRLAKELRLLGSLRTSLPVPTPPGVTSTYIHVDGSRAVFLSDKSATVSGAIWEDRRGLIHLVVGLLDRQDVLSVAEQIG
jgi:hypothetical protein